MLSLSEAFYVFTLKCVTITVESVTFSKKTGFKLVNISFYIRVCFKFHFHMITKISNEMLLTYNNVCNKVLLFSI